MKWMPIESAPTDGTRILVVWWVDQLKAYFHGVVEWDGFEWKEGALRTEEPDFWMPLPRPPAREKADEAML